MTSRQQSPKQRRRALAAAIVGITVLSAAVTASASVTMKPVSILPDQGLDHLTRAVSRSELGRDLFGDPAASTLVGQVEILDRYPYVHSRFVELVTDAEWDRVVFAENGWDIHAWTGEGSHLGPLSGPQGIDRDPDGRIFIADSGNDRIVVAALRGEGPELALEPLYDIRGFDRPAGVAWDGGDTPLDTSDDHLWVADTGNHQIVCVELSTHDAQELVRYGARGNQLGQFLEPRDIEVSRRDGGQGSDLYVADWGNGRLVHLSKGESSIAWRSSRRIGTDLRSVATDSWGNVYVAVRDAGRIVKLDHELEPIIDSGPAFPGIRDLSVGFLTVTDHRDGSRRFAGYGSLTAIEAWSDASGARRLELGAEAVEVEVRRSGINAQLDFVLTDHAEVEVRIVRGTEIIRTLDVGTLDAGHQTVGWDGTDQRGEPVASAHVAYEIHVASRYEDGNGSITRVTPDGAPLAVSPLLEPAWPNPAKPATQIRFFVPDSGATVRLDIIDVAGRVRSRLVEGAVTPGSHAIQWDGTDHNGNDVASGVYLMRLQVGDASTSRKLTLVR